MSGKKPIDKNERAQGKSWLEKSGEVQEANVERGKNGREQSICCQGQIKSGSHSTRKYCYQESRDGAAKNCTFTRKEKDTEKKEPPVTSCYLTDSSKSTLKMVNLEKEKIL